MVAPVIVRNFAAVEIATDNGTFYLNRARLEEAIALLSEVTRTNDSAAMAFRNRYPSSGTMEIWRYMTAARSCVAYNVKP